MTEEFSDPGPIGAVRKGMTVVDASGKDIGHVDTVKMSDPEAETTEGQRPEEGTGPAVVTPMAGVGGSGSQVPAGGTLAGVAGGGRTEPDLPPSLAERLLLSGYLKVDSKGLFKRDVYVAADQIAGVDADTVRLTITGDELPHRA